MSLNEHEPSELQALAPLDRARLVSQALSDAARRARFSMRSRRRLEGTGFQTSRGDTLLRHAVWLSFWLFVATPTIAASVYLGLFASDQYVAEFKFTVAGAEAPPIDAIGALTGIPDVSIIQDTQIVVNHLNSRAAVEALEQQTNLRAKYSDPSIDWLSRFNATKPIEKLVRYWSGMIDASIKMPAGIVEVKVRAFNPNDALAIAQGTLSIGENLINELNERMNKDTMSAAEAEVERA